jgi:hypothetical protein
MATALKSSPRSAWKGWLRWSAAGLLVSALLAATAPSFAAGPANLPRPTVPHRNPGPPGPAASRLADQGPSVRSEAGRARVNVMVIYANRSGQVDPRLREMQRQLADLNFTGFEVLSTHSDQLGPNQSTTLTVEGGRKFEITMISFTAAQARVQIEMFSGSEKKWDTTLTVPRGRDMLAGGTPYQQGKLMFAIEVAGAN